MTIDKPLSVVGLANHRVLLDDVQVTGLAVGETVLLTVHLSNQGNQPAQNVLGQLFEVTDHPDVEILDKRGTRESGGSGGATRDKKNNGQARRPA